MIKKGIIAITLTTIIAMFSCCLFAVSDTTPPSLLIKGPTPNSIKEGGTVSYVVGASDISGIKSFTINPGDIKLNGFTANTNVSGSSLGAKTITLSNIRSTGSSNKTITIAAGVAKDLSGNTSVAATSQKFTIESAPVVKDTTPPSVLVQGPNVKSIVAGGTVSYTVAASDLGGLDKTYYDTTHIIMNGFTANMAVSGNTVTFSNVRSNSTNANKSITVVSGFAVDKAGNKSVAATSATFTIAEAPVAKDTTPPSVLVQGPSVKSIVAGGTVSYTVAASDLGGLDKTYYDTKHIIMNGFTANMSVSGNTVTFSNVRSNSTNANKSITVVSGFAVDKAGNKSVAVNSSTFTITEKPVEVKDTIAPKVTIGNPSVSGVYRGGTVSYVVTFSDDKAVTAVNMDANSIRLNGFTANISVSGTGLKTRTVTLSNIRGDARTGYNITIVKGVAKDAAGNTSLEAKSPNFSILKQIVPATQTVVKPTTTVVKGNCIDDLSLLGDINDEITYFSSWLRAEKYTASYVQENNYVAQDERMTYMVEYYNGSTAPAPDVKFLLTIPYKVEVEEINGNGYVKSKTENETVIEWDMGKIASKAYCRLYVRVRFNKNETLEKSANISETFYATLKTIAGGNTSYSYMRQLFIDKVQSKTGTYKAYLSSIDSTNSIRPEDEITRAEFAKLLADCGIIKVDQNSTAYKSYKDWESIPVYARAAVAALSETDIIQAFPDGTFKPSNPILMEDAVQMITQAATHISDGKLSVYKPTFLYKNALKDSEGDISAKKDYIMELMRQNVIVKYQSNPDKYALRKDIVAIVNALTFRGPYVEKLPANTMKFADIRDNSVYFYNIIGASNSYSFKYDYRLWQEIVEIK